LIGICHSGGNEQKLDSDFLGGFLDIFTSVSRVTVQYEPEQLAVVKIFTDHIQKVKKRFGSRPSGFRVISMMVGRIVNCQNN
jgi:hypothetical protein